MEASQSINLATPSPELDEAIAKACGLQGFIYATVQATPERRYFVMEDRAQGRRWEPSTDLNAALEAAEKALGPTWDLSAGGSGNWECSTAGFAPKVIEFGTTPALAICAAILALKG